MRQDRPHQLVEHLRFRLDRTARVGVYVPGAQLVQRRRLLVREPEQVFVSPAGRRVQDLAQDVGQRSEEHTSELQSPCNLVCRLLLEKKKKTRHTTTVP